MLFKFASTANMDFNISASDSFQPTTLLIGPAGITRELRSLAPVQLEKSATVTTVAAAIEVLRSTRWDLVISCLELEDGSALEVVTEMRAHQVDAGTILIADNPAALEIARAVRLQVTDLLLQPVTASAFAHALQSAHQRTLMERARRKQLQSHSFSIGLLERRKHTLKREACDMEAAVIDSMMAALELREQCGKHPKRVAAYSRHIAVMAGYPAALLPHLEHAALLHDIGKLYLPAELIMRVDSFTSADMERIKPHAALGGDTLKRFTFLRPAALLVRHHHERFDGSGYPDGLASDTIPLGARILSIADAMDALTTDRFYRVAQTFEEGLAEIDRWSGRQFDPALVSIVLRTTPDEWRAIRASVEDDKPDGSSFRLMERCA